MKLAAGRAGRGDGRSEPRKLYAAPDFITVRPDAKMDVDDVVFVIDWADSTLYEIEVHTIKGDTRNRMEGLIFVFEAHLHLVDEMLKVMLNQDPAFG